MQNDGAVTRPLRSNVLELHPSWERVIELNGRELGRPTQSVMDFKIDLRAVECALLRTGYKRYAQVPEDAVQNALATFPHRVVANALRRIWPR
jgi:hypothetical protein